MKLMPTTGVFHVAGEGDVSLDLSKDITVCRGFELISNVSVPVEGAQYLDLRPKDGTPVYNELYKI